MADCNKDITGKNGIMASSKDDTKSQVDKSLEDAQHQQQLSCGGSALSANSLENEEQQLKGKAPAESDTFVVQDGLPVISILADPVIDSADFQELVRELCYKVNPDIRIESTAIAALHISSKLLLDGLFEICLSLTPQSDLRLLSDAEFKLIKGIINALVLASAAD